MAFKYFYYDHQLKRYLTQFMAIFAGMQVAVPKKDVNDSGFISVPITHGSKDRVVAAILGKNTQTAPLKVPIMAAHMSNLNMAPELRKGIGTERRNVSLPRGGSFPDDVEVTYQMMPVPYLATMELAIFASNQDQHMQIMEQILMLFDPIVQIQISNGTLDLARISTVELKGINFNENYPQGTQRRLIQTTLSFDMPVYISAPSNIKDNYIKDIYLRIGVVSDVHASPDEIMAELDVEGAMYELIASADDLGIDTT